MNEDGFYFPHNLDFRGRAYPMHPNLNHLGADLSRGLLQFADAKPLGPDGLRWLEISVSYHAPRSDRRSGFLAERIRLAEYVPSLA